MVLPPRLARARQRWKPSKVRRGGGSVSVSVATVPMRLYGWLDESAGPTNDRKSREGDLTFRGSTSVGLGRSRLTARNVLAALRAHWLFVVPLGFFALHYTLQNVPGYLTLPKDLVTTFMSIMALTVAVYVLVYRYAKVDWVERIIPLRPSLVTVDAVAGIGMLVYLAILVTTCATAQHVPLFAAFAGASALELGEYRETFLRTRTDMGVGLKYAYVILNNSVMPIVVTYALWSIKWWRHLALTLFVVGLSLTLQKGAIAAAALPLLVLFAMQRRRRAFIVTAVSSVALVILMYILASGRLGSIVEESGPETWQASETFKDSRTESRADVQVRNASAVPESYNILGRDDQLSLIVNRVVWIPYVTAIDWLRYRRDELHGKLVLGRSIKPFAFLLGKPPINLENEVSALQWGQNETGTASSNAVFFVDAWVNFGVLGVIAYAALFAFTVKVIATSRFVPLTVSAVVPVYTACLVALPPVFLSGGLAIFLVLALLLRGDCRDSSGASS